jgi:hypothetical protein
MSGNYSEDGSTWTRLGSEKTTFQCVEKVADGEGPDQYSYHVIDHVLQGPGMDKALAAGTHFVHGSKQYHLSVEIEIVTVAPELVQTSSSSKPKLGKMPQQPKAPKARAKALAKRAAERADALPEHEYTGAGSLVDDVDVVVSDDELFERRPLNDEMGAEPVGWAAYQDRVTAEAIESLRDYDMKKELAQTGALDALRKEKRGLTEEETAAALRSASTDFRLKHGTRTEILMETCKRVAREGVEHHPVPRAVRLLGEPATRVLLDDLEGRAALACVRQKREVALRDFDGRGVQLHEREGVTGARPRRERARAEARDRHPTRT